MRADRQRNRDAIVGAAAAMFVQHGADVPLEEIARAAGVGSATLYRHFSGRSALTAAVYEDEIDRLAQAARIPGQDDLWSWLTAVVQRCAADRALLLALDPNAIASGPEAWEPLRVAAAPLVQRARESGDLRPEVTADDLLRLVDAIARGNAGDPAGAVRLLAIVRRGSGHPPHRTP